MVLTPEQLAENNRLRAVNDEILRRHLKPGDVLTHNICGGSIQEHRFTGWEGMWLSGEATRDTMIISHRARGWAQRSTSISPNNVTHVNRERIDALDDLAAMMGKDPIHAGAITEKDLPF